MSLDPPFIAAKRAESLRNRAERDHRYVVVAFESYLATRDRQRNALIKKLDKIGTGPQEDRRRLYVEELLKRFEEEDVEEADPKHLSLNPRSNASQRPAYKKLAFEAAIHNAEQRLEKAKSVHEQAMAEAEVDRAISEGSDNSSVGTSSPPASYRSGSRPGMVKLDSKLNQLMTSRSLERGFSVRSDTPQKIPTPPTSGRGKWLSGWGMHGVSATTVQFKERIPLDASPAPPPEE